MTYIIYALTSVTVSVTSTLISTSSPYTGVIRFAALNTTDAAAQSALDASSATYATSKKRGGREGGWKDSDRIECNIFKYRCGYIVHSNRNYSKSEFYLECGSR
jgi:hypothetical protein